MSGGARCYAAPSLLSAAVRPAVHTPPRPMSSHGVSTQDVLAEALHLGFSDARRRPKKDIEVALFCMIDSPTLYQHLGD